jgi:cobyrinic acid a,c-diamide synthase
LKKALCITATASNQGKTLLTMALLSYYKSRVRPFKIGPDFIDPQFHAKISQTHSINLDGYMMDDNQLRWVFWRYMEEKEVAIMEGVMGFYDGMDKGASAYDVTSILKIPSLLILDASGSYITVAAVLKGMLTFQKRQTIKAVVLNRVSSSMHYELIKKELKKVDPTILVVGWIQKELPALASRHLGLDLRTLEDEGINCLAQEVLKHIDIQLLESIMGTEIPLSRSYPFEVIVRKEEHCVLVKDAHFSFVYHDNIAFLGELYGRVSLISAADDQAIPQDADIVILPGGYVETDEAYASLRKAERFQESLIRHAHKGKKIYAECAGLIYLGERIDDKPMSGILPITFTLGEKRERLGYYQSNQEQAVFKGHAFHYSKVLDAPPSDCLLFKTTPESGKAGGWRQANIFGTYLHTMWRVKNPIV